MIVFQSTVTGMAERPAANPEPAAGMPSPGGEGELNTNLGRDAALRRPQGQLNFCPLCPFLSLSFIPARLFFASLLPAFARYCQPLPAILEKKLFACWQRAAASQGKRVGSEGRKQGTFCYPTQPHAHLCNTPLPGVFFRRRRREESLISPWTGHDQSSLVTTSHAIFRKKRLFISSEQLARKRHTFPLAPRFAFVSW